MVGGGAEYLLTVTKMKTEMFRKFRGEFTRGKLPSTDARQLAERIVPQSWMLEVVFRADVEESALPCQELCT